MGVVFLVHFNLVVNAIILWNTTYLSRAAAYAATVQALGDHAALARVRSALAIRSNRCPYPAPSVPL